MNWTGSWFEKPKDRRGFEFASKLHSLETKEFKVVQVKEGLVLSNGKLVWRHMRLEPKAAICLCSCLCSKTANANWWLIEEKYTDIEKFGFVEPLSFFCSKCLLKQGYKGVTKENLNLIRTYGSLNEGE